MVFGIQRVVYLILLWGAWACIVARVAFMLIPRWEESRVRARVISTWQPLVVAAALVLSLVLRPAHPGTYVLLDFYDWFVALCAGHVLAAGLSERHPGSAKIGKMIWSMGGILIGVAALLGFGGDRAATIPPSLRSPLFSLSNLVLSAGVGVFLLAVVTEGAYLWGARRGLDPTAGKVLGRRAMGWATVAIAATLMLGGIGGFLAWGACWSWDPVELWHLSLGLLYALLVHTGLGRAPGDIRRAVVLLAALVFSIFVLFGAGPLVRGLGLPSRLVW